MKVFFFFFLRFLSFFIIFLISVVCSLSGDTASADKTDALAAQLVSGVKAVLVARTTPGASQEQLLAAKNGFVPVASACRNLWSL